jgi:O-antigen/teichoic acid export membrane protein
MSEKWRDGDFKWFGYRFLRQIFIVMGITAVCVVGAYFLGIPVLSLVYGTNLEGYREELIVLLAGGGLLALANQLITIVTIIRRQKLLIAGFGACAILAFLLSTPVVSKYSIMGAAVLELILMFVLCVTFTSILWVEIKREEKRRKNN